MPRESAPPADSTAPEEPARVSLDDEIGSTQASITRLDEERQQLERRLQVLDARRQRGDADSSTAVRKASPPTTAIPAAEKIRVFRSLFRGREDVFPVRFERKDGRAGYTPACSNRFVNGLCNLPEVKCRDCGNKVLVPVRDQDVNDHLRGHIVMGVYPLLPDNTCWFLAIDFDKRTWMDDVRVVREACARLSVPVYVERSRSGNGAHTWFFFAAPVPAASARRFGSAILTEAMSLRPELSFDSYDRMFPNQDKMPAGGLGNLIALPLQEQPRKHGNSVFVDEEFQALAWDAQWALLASVEKLAPYEVENIVRKAAERGSATATLSFPDKEEADDEALSPWLRLPSGKPRFPELRGTPPEKIAATLGQRLFVNRDGLPSSLVAQIKRLAAFHNPEFYRRDKQGRSTWNTPRFMSRAELHEHHVSVPRGCLGALEELANRHGIPLHVSDVREPGQVLDVAFHGELSVVQQRAFSALTAHDIGIFVASPGVGKTVVGAALVAHRRCSTLVLVHRRQLMEQWCAQFEMFLQRKPSDIGRIVGKRGEANGLLDVAMVQSLEKGGAVNDLVAGYGQIIVDECHHAAAPSFERVLSSIRARFVVGLTATPQRRDGHQTITRMQIGPVRFEVKAKTLAAERPFRHTLIVRDTAFELHESEKLRVGEIQSQLAVDPARNAAILEDIISTLAEGRRPLVLSERRAQVDYFASRLRPYARNVVVLVGGAAKRADESARATLANARPNDATVVVATGKFAGEGFDDPSLDTLFLAAPISWKGTLVQYTGRLHRLHPRKREVRIFDYVDRKVPAMVRMFESRLRGYRAIGYEHGELPLDFEVLGEEWPAGDAAEYDGEGVE